MKRTFALATLLVSSLALNAAAQSLPSAPAPAGSMPAPTAAPAATAPAGPAKVAVIAFQAAVGQTNEGQRDFADVQKKFEPKRQQLKTLSDEIDNLKKQLQAQGDKLSPAESASRTKTIDDKSKQLQRSVEDAQNDYQQAMGEAGNALASKVYEVLAAYAQQQGYTLVLDVSQQQSPVLWASEATNITLPIIAAYNAKSGVPAPPAAPAGQPSAPKPQAPTVNKPPSGAAAPKK